MKYKAKEGACFATFLGRLKNELKKELEDAGYEIEEYISNLGYHCTRIKWDKKGNNKAC